MSETIIHSHQIHLERNINELALVKKGNAKFVTIINRINRTLSSLIQLNTPSRLGTLYDSVKKQMNFSVQLNRVIQRHLDDLEISIVFQTFQGRSSFLLEKYMSQIIHKIDENISPSLLFKIANKLFIFAEKNKKWCSENKGKLCQILNNLQDHIHSINISAEKINKIATCAELALRELDSKIVFTHLNIQGKSNKVNTLKFLYVSKYAQKIHSGNYSETTSKLISFDTLSFDTFQAVKIYIDTHKTDFLNSLSTPELIKIYEWTNHLMIDGTITKKWADEITRRLSHMTVQPTANNNLSVSFYGQPCDKSLEIITNPVINAQIIDTDLSAISGLDSESLKNVLSVFTNTGSVRVSFPNSIERSGWIQLYNIIKVKELHLDFKCFDSCEENSFQETVYALQEVADSLKKINLKLKIHIHNAGKTNYEILLMLHHSLAENITTLDLSGSQISNAQFKAVLEGTKNLARLNLSNCKNITEDSMISITEKCPMITDLSLNRTKYATDTVIQSICKHFPAITVLNLAWQSSLTNAAFESIAYNCPKITTLDLTNANKITDSSICLIATKCKNLGHLKLNWCTELTSASLDSLSTHSNNLRDLTLTGAFQRKKRPSIEVFSNFLNSIERPLKLTISEYLFSSECIAKLRADYPSITIVTQKQIN